MKKKLQLKKSGFVKGGKNLGFPPPGPHAVIQSKKNTAPKHKTLENEKNPAMRNIAWIETQHQKLLPFYIDAMELKLSKVLFDFFTRFSATILLSNSNSSNAWVSLFVSIVKISTFSKDFASDSLVFFGMLLLRFLRKTRGMRAFDEN